MRAAEEAMHEAAKYATRCEALSALVEVARATIEQARAAATERAQVAAEAAAAAVEAAERLHMEQETAALALRMQSDEMRMQDMQAQLGVVAPPPTRATLTKLPQHGSYGLQHVRRRPLHQE